MKSPQRRVLVVDDDPALRKTLVEILTGDGYRVVDVATGRTALKRLVHSRFNVVLLDLRLSDMPGLELLKQIRSHSPDTVCIALTDHTLLDAAVEAIKLGAYNFLRKPYAPEKIRLTIAHACEQHERDTARREREALTRAVTECSPHGILIVDENYSFTYVNEPACRLTGYSQEELLGRDFRDFVDDESREMMSERYARRQRGEDVTPRYEFGLIRKDGKLRRMALSASVIRSDQGAVQTFCHLRDITHHKRERSEVEMREATLQSIFRAAPEGIGLVRDHAFIWVNERITKLTGYPIGELEGHKARLLYTDDAEFERVGYTTYSLIAKYGVASVETQWKCKDGTVRDIYLSSSALDSDDPSQGYIFTASDITERKRTQSKLIASEARYRSLFDGVPVGLYRTMPDGEVTDANRAMVEILGYPDRRTLLAVNAADHYYDPAERQRWQEVVAHMDIVHDYDVQMKRYDGTPLWVRNSTRLMRDTRGKIQHYEGSLRDITDRYEAEIAREESETRYRRVSALTSDYAYAFRVTEDEELTIDWITGAYKRITGYDPDNLMARGGWVNLIHPDDLSEWLGHVKQLLAGKADTIIYRIRTRRREVRWMRDHALPEIDNETHLTIRIHGAVQDITEQKQAEEGLKRSLEDLKRSNRDLEHFAYVASHDLQEPLRMVSSYVQLLAKRYQGQLDEDADEFISYAADGAQRMQVLINDLLSFSRIRTRGKAFAEVDCEALIATVLSDLQIAITEKQALITHDPLPKVMGDGSQLAHLLQNMISNALKFRSSAQPKIHIGAERMAKEWVFSVRDNGVGIDPQYHDRIFVIFRRLTTNDKISGTGIGLALCKNIVERHGGRIWVESQSGEGATFYFTIPLRKVDGNTRVTS